MTMHGEFVAPDTIRFERTLPGPIERVWEYLTDSEKRGKWLATGPMDLRVGGAVEMVFNNTGLSPRREEPPEKYKHCDNGEPMRGRITRIEPPRVLAYTWGESWGEDSEVTFELSPKGDDVLLVLTHRRLKGRDTKISVAAGWDTHTSILRDILRGEEARPFWSTHTRLEAEYEPRVPREQAPAR